MADISLTDVITYKKLVACGNGEVWYEVSAGTMMELPAADSDIDTTDQLNIFEAFQKVFVVNGANLKVADFINTKLTHTTLTTAHARGDILTQNTNNKMVVDFTNTTKTATYGFVTAGIWDVTNAVTGSGSGTTFTPTGINGMLTHAVLATAHASNDTLTQATTSATMVVEYTDATKTHTWGRITAGTFNTTNSVTGSGSGSAFTPTATDISPPVWYDWTVYAGGASGTMPAKAYLGCLYRGRNVLAGNPNYPHQWYMSKVADPFNWVYSDTDPLTAVAGNNTDAGEIGDIVRALIPYKDDYLVFGCASTIWVLTGDPAASGEIDEVDLTVGIFGANSWCFDGDSNLYFWGTNGIYKIPVGFRSVENLTEISLPNLVGDEGADPSSHRITLGYDRKRHGILICITKLSDGSNSNYWYDIKLKGFFPESYPDECGAYSLFYYAANDNDYADLLVGCKDGYIRKFDETAKDDDIGGSDQAILSYAVWPIQHLTEDNDKEGKLTSLTIELSGGASGGAFPDTDGVSYELHIGDDAETVIEDIKDGATPFSSGTLSGTGRKARIRTRARGAWLGIKFLNSTASETWAVNRIFGEIKEAGKIR
ncbi:hypothetical protein LCGC14_1131230 [marine sediment metagenome]|uniref:Uncharacterized protein n=1 Tax=marine sediment metagenome TaxID=412755 RepID=A0A0F9M0Y2_9ZZZZ